MHPPAGPTRWIAITLSMGGIIESVSASAERITGYAADELVGKPVTQVLGDRSVFEIAHIIESARAWGAWEGRIVHRDRSGTTLDARGSLARLGGQDPAAARYSLVSVFEDGTADESASERAALEQVGARLRALAHEINNPLAVIMGFSQLILLNADCTGKIRVEMEKLVSEVSRLTEIAARLQNYAHTLDARDEQPRQSRVGAQ